jgi:hypothetical protein
MLSQDRGEIRSEIRSVIKIFDIRTIHAEDVIHADRRKTLDNVVNHPVSPGYRVHAVTADGAYLDVSAMVPNTRCAITPYMEPPSASAPVVGNRHHLGVDGFRCEHGLCADCSMMDRGEYWRRYRR